MSSRPLASTLLLLLAFSLACGAPEEEEDDDKPRRDREDTDTDDPRDSADTDTGDPRDTHTGDTVDTGDTQIDTDPDCETWYDDIDGDGYGNPATAVETCDPEPEAVRRGGDCNDLNTAISPAATEVCDEIDNDCDELVDDEDDSTDTSTGAEFAFDDDGDGFYGTDHTEWACVRPAGAGPVDSARDCDDTDDTVNPDAEEVCDNGADDDCDGSRSPCGVSSGTSSDADIKYTGGNASDHAGWSVAIGDIDGNGDADLAVGSPEADSGSYNPGEVLVYVTNGSGTVTESSAWGALRLGTTSTYDDAYFGSSAAFVGDQNSDGKDDLVVGAIGYWSSKGMVSLYRGASSLPSSSSWSAYGGSNGYECGAAVAGGLDLTGDSTDDYVYSCIGESGGSIYVVDDSTTSEISETSSSSMELGASLAAGDFNGDGKGDLVATTGGTNDLYLYTGNLSSGSSSSLVDETDTSKAWVYVGAVGDVDDDGYEDFVAGGEYGGGVTAHLFPGAASSILSGEFNVSNYMMSAAGGDFDGDGVTDLAIGNAGSAAAYVYVAYGPITGPPSWESISGTAKGLGTSLAAGDLDDDGLDDLAAGGPYDDDAGTDAGAVFVFLGGGM